MNNLGQLLDLIYVNRVDTTEQFNGTGDVHLETNTFYTLPLKYRIKQATLIYDSESCTSNLWASFELNEEGAPGNISDGMTTHTFLDNIQTANIGEVQFYPSTVFQHYGLMPGFAGTTTVYNIMTDIFVDGTKQPLSFVEYYTDISGSNPAAAQIFSFILVLTVEVL